MRRITRSPAVAGLALLALTVGTGSATASRSIGFEPARASTNTGVITLRTLPAEGISWSCQLSMTLEYEINNVRKTVGERVGRITEARITNCVETIGIVIWTMTVLVEPFRPSTMLYQGFTGTLPNIATVLMKAERLGIQIRGGMTTCLYRGDLPFQIFEREGRTRFDKKRFLTSSLAYVEGNCEPRTSLEVQGTVSLSPAQNVSLH